MLNGIKRLTIVVVLLSIGLEALAQEDCPPPGPLAFPQRAGTAVSHPAGLGESAGGTFRRPCTSYFCTEPLKHGTGTFSRSGRAAFGIDEHVRNGNSSEPETHTAMTADEYGNLWLVFEDRMAKPQRLTLYGSNDGGENWQFLGCCSMISSL